MQLTRGAGAGSGGTPRHPRRDPRKRSDIFSRRSCKDLIFDSDCDGRHRHRRTPEPRRTRCRTHHRWSSPWASPARASRPSGPRWPSGCGCPFADADDFHPPANIAKMTAGQALDDDDRHPWLEAIGEWLVAHGETGGVMSCSALKRKYRDQLRHHAADRRVPPPARQPRGDRAAPGQPPRALHAGVAARLAVRHPRAPRPRRARPASSTSTRASTRSSRPTSTSTTRPADQP